MIEELLKFFIYKIDRDVSNIYGFTREILSAVIANIETAEWRCCHSSFPDNPRTNTTDDEELTLHCPQQRMKMSNEMASQKAEKEKNERANQPKLKNEKDFEHDQCKAIEKAREREERGDIKQCNGKDNVIVVPSVSLFP